MDWGGGEGWGGRVGWGRGRVGWAGAGEGGWIGVRVGGENFVGPPPARLPARPPARPPACPLSVARPPSRCPSPPFARTDVLVGMRGMELIAHGHERIHLSLLRHRVPPGGCVHGANATAHENRHADAGSVGRT